MFLMFPVHNTQKLKPHHYNKYKNIYTNFISISITKKINITKQYNVPQQNSTMSHKNTTTKNEQKHKMNKNTTKQKKH